VNQGLDIYNMRHIKSRDQFLNEQLFQDANRYAKLIIGGDSKSKGGEGETETPTGPVVNSRDDESSCPNNNCWAHFGKEAFWNGSSKINGKTVPKITINKTANSFNITYEGAPSGFLLKHGKGGKDDTIHQLLNVLTSEINPYLKENSSKPDIKAIKMDMSGKKLSISVPLLKLNDDNTHYTLDRRGGLGHAGDYSDLEKYRSKKGYEEVVHKSGNLTEKFVTFIDA